MNSLDIVLPVYNEVKVLEQSVYQVCDYLASSDESGYGRIVIADNGSNDGTTELAERLASKNNKLIHVHIPNRGRGAALRHIWLTSTADFSLYMDIDLSTHLDAIADACEELSGGADVVVGSRLHRDAETTRSLNREFLSRGYNMLVSRTLGTTSFDDAQCGFKAIRTGAVRRLLPYVKNNDWFFDTELLAIAEHSGLDVRSIPVRWTEDRDSKVNIVSTVVQDIKGILRLRYALPEITAALSISHIELQPMMV